MQSYFNTVDKNVSINTRYLFIYYIIIIYFISLLVFISEFIFVFSSTYFALNYTCSKWLPDKNCSLFTIPKSVVLLIWIWKLPQDHLVYFLPFKYIWYEW